MKIFILILCFTSAIARNLENNPNPIVQTPVGPYQGSIMKSQMGNEVFAFRGIRYAEAPTGQNRFKASTPVPPHVDLYDATNDGPLCPQPYQDERETSEDCLTLNIYTTELPKLSDNSSTTKLNRPVVVLFHPGAFYSSSGSSFDLGPQIVVDSNLIFVTPNYRLGALGFLSTGDERAPGNAGLKDQVLALKWIQRNIEAFGGNPNSVTISGHGAGAMSVTLHMVSPMSKGLFHRAITMSGAATVHKPLPNNQIHLAKIQAVFLGCPPDDSDKMFQCFYQTSADKFADSVSNFALVEDYPGLIYTPVVEQDCSRIDNECFLPAQPLDIIRMGTANFVPLYTGINKDEFSQVIKPTESQVKNRNISFSLEFNKEWRKVSPLDFGIENAPSRSVPIKRKLYHFYSKDHPTGLEMYRKIAQLYADAFTIFPMHRFERLMATYSPKPVYFYHDIYVGCDTYGNWWNGTGFGVAHADELLLGYIIGGRPAHCPQDVFVAQQIMLLLMNFITTDEPMPGEFGKAFGCKWEPSTKDKPQYMEFGAGGAKMVPGYVYHDRMTKWDELFTL